jgi:glycosyltransferase 2 family protein
LTLTLTGGALLAAGWSIAARRPVPQLETDLTRAITNAPSAWYPYVWPPMQLGSLGGGLATAAIVGVLAARGHADPRLAKAMGIAVPVAWFAGKAVKSVVQRGRPASYLPDMVPRETAAGLGFVSGHTAVTFALASAAVGFVPRRVRPVMFGTAGFVGLSRVYVGAHLPADVVGGAGLGLIVGAASAVVVSPART